MVKVKCMYGCIECGVIFLKWVGQCVDCGVWNILVEIVVEVVLSGFGCGGWVGQQVNLKILVEVSVEEMLCFMIGFIELDWVFGGGLVDGLVVLIGGDFGIGKLIIFLQIFCNLVSCVLVLYVIGEEFQQQVVMCVWCLLLLEDKFKVMIEISIEIIIVIVCQEQLWVMVIDLIQIIFIEQL